MTALVRRLRQWGDTAWVQHLGIGSDDERYALAADCRAAADRIAALEGALRENWSDAHALTGVELRHLKHVARIERTCEQALTPQPAKEDA